MKNRRLILLPFIILIIAAMLGTSQAWAADAPSNENSSPNIRYCQNLRDVNGLWKLETLFERPEGDLSREYQEKPHQYIIFSGDGLYYNDKTAAPYKNVRRAGFFVSKSSGKDIWQFIVGDKGVIYLYKNQVFSHSVFCGKVTNAFEDYEVNDMILTPTDTGNRQIYLTYKRLK